MVLHALCFSAVRTAARVQSNARMLKQLKAFLSGIVGEEKSDMPLAIIVDDTVEVGLPFLTRPPPDGALNVCHIPTRRPLDANSHSCACLLPLLLRVFCRDIHTAPMGS